MGEFLFFIEVLIGGLLSGVMYSLVALGFVLIFKASGVFNFAQGALVLFAALTFVFLLEYGDGGAIWPWMGGLALLLAAVAFGLAFLIKPQTPAKQRKTIHRTVLAVLAMAVVVLAVFYGDDRTVWRAAFISIVTFLVLVFGAGYARPAGFVLAALAVLCLLPVGEVLPGGAWNFWRSLVTTLMVMVILAMAIERVALRPLVNQAHIILFMVTIGLNFLIEGIAQGVWDSQVHGLEIGIPDMPIESLSESTGIFISQFDVFAAATAGVLVIGLAVFFQKTRIGRALRAVADDHQASLAVGIPLKDIWAIVWSVAGFVALVAGVLWGARLGVQFSLSLIVLKALPVLILGGFTSVPGAIVGGLLIGATEKLFEVYVGIAYLGGGTESWIPYVMALLFLLFRPQGLFGERIIERV
jgi:branched-chain amino acid transport system permease protein